MAAPAALSAREGQDSRVVAAVGPTGLLPQAMPSAAAPEQGSTVHARSDETPAASSATPAGEGVDSYGALGLALLALVLWVGTRLRRRD